MTPRKDYTVYSFLLAATVIGLLLVLGLIPAFSLAGVSIKRINILSDVYARQEADAAIVEYSDTTFQSESLAASAGLGEALSLPTGATQSWNVSPSGITEIPQGVPAGCATPTPERDMGGDEYGKPATLIEDFSPDQAMQRFYEALQRGHTQRPVRIAVLGDSFIEADIITVDLREQLQLLFGGEGPGFVPFASPLARYRASVKHTCEGWESYNVIKKKSAPVVAADKFYVSGLVCTPSEGAWTRVCGTEFRQRLSHSGVARLLFINEQQSTLDVTVNDSLQHTFTPEASPLVQQINLYGDISSIKVCVRKPAGFTGYGILLESPQGVSVDNYSVRSNSGMALFGTSSAINAQIGRLLGGYDLIILQYGLNAMSPDILGYNTYSDQLVRITNYIKECFPRTAIMLMSVGDRSTLKGGAYVTMPAAKAMLAAQHRAAEKAGVAFWNTFQAMGGEGSMVKFVNNKWASKDYTHIGYPGGKYIATEMVRSVLYGVRLHNGERLNLDSIAMPDYTAPVSTGVPLRVTAPVLPGSVAPADSSVQPAATHPDTTGAPAALPAPEHERHDVTPSSPDAVPAAAAVPVDVTDPKPDALPQ